MHYVIIDERGEIIPRRLEFVKRHPSASHRASAILASVKHPHWTEKPLSDRNLIIRFGMN